MNQNTGCFEVKGSYTGVPGKEWEVLFLLMFNVLLIMA